MSIFDDQEIIDKRLEESILVTKFLKEFQEKFAKEIELEHDNYKI